MARIVAVAGQACRSVEVPSAVAAVAAFVVGVDQFVGEPFVFARKDSGSNLETSSAAMGWLEACSSAAVAAGFALAVAHQRSHPAVHKSLMGIAPLVVAA